MPDAREQPSTRGDQRLALMFHLAWITAAAVIILLMRVLVDPHELGEDLSALDEAETVKVEIAGRLPSTLEPLTEPLPASLASNVVYVPLFRTLYVGQERAVNKLSATLSIHNTSPKHALVLNKLTYFDGAGEAIEESLESPHVLLPMASAEFYIDPSESDAAAIAATVVEWSGETSITPPLVEAIVIGKYGAKGFSIHSRGVSLP